MLSVFLQTNKYMPLNTHVLAYSLFIFESIRSLYAFAHSLQLFRFRLLLPLARTTARSLAGWLCPFHFSLSLALAHALFTHRKTLSVHSSVYAYNLSTIHKYKAVCTVSHTLHTTQHFYKMNSTKKKHKKKNKTVKCS